MNKISLCDLKSMFQNLEINLTEHIDKSKYTPLLSSVRIKKREEDLCEYCEYLLRIENRDPYYYDSAYYGDQEVCTCSKNLRVSYRALLISAVGNPILTKPEETIFNYRSWNGLCRQRDIPLDGKFVEFSIQRTLDDEYDPFHVEELIRSADCQYSVIHPTSYKHVSSLGKYQQAFHDLSGKIVKSESKEKREPKTNSHVSRRTKK